MCWQESVCPKTHSPTISGYNCKWHVKSRREQISQCQAEHKNCATLFVALLSTAGNKVYDNEGVGRQREEKFQAYDEEGEGGTVNISDIRVQA